MMNKIYRIKCLYVMALIAFVYCLVTSFVCINEQIANQPPQVEIIKPSANQHFSWNSIIQYSINVKDKEDGFSEYEEINVKEVLMEVRYLPDVASAKKYLAKKRNEKEHPGLNVIRQSDCFTCHASKDKLIGPSFELIAKRYSGKPGATALIVKNILHGSKGRWGNETMIAHPSLTASQAGQIVKWILNNGGNPDLAYYTGIEGAFKTKKQPVKKVMVLTASYTDHGDKNSNQNKRYGQYSIMLQPK